MGNWISSNEQLTNTIEQQAQAIVELKQQVAELQKNNGSPTRPKLPSVSRKKLLVWIDKQLDDPANNITAMPDFMERQLKAQIFGMLLNMIDYILETTRIDFMGHSIKFDLFSDSNTSSKD